MGTSGGDVSGGGGGGSAPDRGPTGDDAAWRDLVARYDMITDLDIALPPWPEQEDLRTGQRGQEPQDQEHSDQAAPGQVGPVSGPTARPGDKARVIRHATAATPRPPAEQDEPDQDTDEHFIPPPPPPLPHLDPVAKGAWTGLLGGPGYLLVASMAGWFVPGWAALAAVAAFVAGFTVVVMRLGDDPPRGAGPDNGAIL